MQRSTGRRYFALAAGLVLAAALLYLAPRRVLGCLMSLARYFTRPKLDPRAGSEPVSGASPAAAGFTGGNRVRLLVNGDEILPVLLEKIAGARRAIRWQVMIFSPDETGSQLIHALAEAARRGVRVQLSFDISQSIDPAELLRFSSRTAPTRRKLASLIQTLRQAGGEVRTSAAGFYKPKARLSRRTGQILREIRENTCIPLNHYDHRKLFIFDDDAAVIGGTNVAKQYLYHGAHGFPARQGGESEKYFDSAALIEGPVVEQMIDEFNWKWEALGGVPIKSGPAGEFPEGLPVQFMVQRPGISQLGSCYFDLVREAQRELWVASPFVSYEPALEALQTAARRGVRVVLVFPNASQAMGVPQRIFQESAGELVGSGMELYFNDLRMAHTKMIVVDGQLALFGSFNLNYRSFFHDLEDAVLVKDETIAQEVIERVFLPYLRISRRAVHPPVSRRSAVNWLLRPFS